jgi:hypothetical protein
MAADFASYAANAPLDKKTPHARKHTALVMKAQVSSAWQFGLALVHDSAAGRIYAVCTGLTDAERTEFQDCLRAALARACCSYMASRYTADAATPSAASTAVAGTVHQVGQLPADSPGRAPPTERIPRLLAPPSPPPHPLMLLLPIVLLSLHCRQFERDVFAYADALWELQAATGLYGAAVWRQPPDMAAVNLDATIVKLTGLADVLTGARARAEALRRALPSLQELLEELTSAAAATAAVEQPIPGERARIGSDNRTAATKSAAGSAAEAQMAAAAPVAGGLDARGEASADALARAAEEFALQLRLLEQTIDGSLEHISWYQQSAQSVVQTVTALPFHTRILHFPAFCPIAPFLLCNHPHTQLTAPRPASSKTSSPVSTRLLRALCWPVCCSFVMSDDAYGTTSESGAYCSSALHSHRTARQSPQSPDCGSVARRQRPQHPDCSRGQARQHCHAHHSRRDAAIFAGNFYRGGFSPYVVS